MGETGANGGRIPQKEGKSRVTQGRKYLKLRATQGRKSRKMQCTEKPCTARHYTLCVIHFPLCSYTRQRRISQC